MIHFYVDILSVILHRDAILSYHFSSHNPYFCNYGKVIFFSLPLLVFFAMNAGKLGLKAPYSPNKIAMLNFSATFILLRWEYSC